MDPPDNFDDFLDDIEPMTPEKQRELLLRFFALQIGGVDRATLLATRAHVMGLPEAPERETLIEVFDGQLFGVSYNTINIWIFCVVWPLFTVALIAAVIWQRLMIRRLTKARDSAVA